MDRFHGGTCRVNPSHHNVYKSAQLHSFVEYKQSGTIYAHQGEKNQHLFFHELMCLAKYPTVQCEIMQFNLKKGDKYTEEKIKALFLSCNISDNGIFVVLPRWFHYRSKIAPTYTHTRTHAHRFAYAIHNFPPIEFIIIIAFAC